MQRDGRTWEPAVAAGRVDAAAASDMFVPVMKTEGGDRGTERGMMLLYSQRRAAREAGINRRHRTQDV